MEIGRFCTLSPHLRRPEPPAGSSPILAGHSAQRKIILSHRNPPPRVAAGHCCLCHSVAAAIWVSSCCCFESTLVAVLLLLSLSRSAAAGGGYCGETSSAEQSKFLDKEIGQFITSTRSVAAVGKGKAWLGTLDHLPAQATQSLVKVEFSTAKIGLIPYCLGFLSVCLDPIFVFPTSKSPVRPKS